MWYSINETFSNICSSVFWDNDVTWNSADPRFTDCFEKTILTWIPCLFLWSFLPMEIYYLLHKNADRIPFNLYNISKLATIAVLGAAALFDIGVYIFTHKYTLFSSVDIYTSVLKFSTFCLFFGLTYANIKHGVRSSGVLFIFSLSLVFCGAPHFRTALKSWPDVYQLLTNKTTNRPINEEFVHFVTYLIYYAFALTILLLNCFADAYPDVVQNQSTETKPCPERRSSFLSRIFFSWTNGFVWRGYRKTLTYEDVWDLDDHMAPAYQVQRFESKWSRNTHSFQKPTHANAEVRFEGRSVSHNGKELIKPHVKRNRKKTSVLRPLIKTFGWQFTIGVLIRLCWSVLSFLNPQVLNWILTFVENENKFLWHGYLFAFLLFAIAIFQMLLESHHVQTMVRIGLQIRSVLVSVIYRKALKISNRSRKDFTSGEIVNLMAVDAQALDKLMLFLPLLWVIPIEICVSLYYLWTILGPSSVSAFIVSTILIIGNSLVISRIQKLEMRQMKYKDERLKLINEVLSGIKVLKLYAYEPFFEERIRRIRDNEIRVLKNAAYLRAASSFTWRCAPFLISFVTFSVYVLSSEESVLNAQVAFVSLSLFNVITLCMELSPLLITFIVRVRPIFFSEAAQEAEPVVIENGNFSWEHHESLPILKNVDVNVKSGSLIAIVGPVGSGKSSLLSAILGDMYKQSGFVNTTGSIAYVPQEAWIQNTTLRNNITFGLPAENSYYHNVLEACALIPDIEILPAGDQTEIGEKGVNLSGGQKQRVSLARAVFGEADIYLLDDPLSAVDARVGKHIFEHVIGPLGLLNKKTRIFVTHNVTYLPQVDYILVLQNGAISESGTYSELMRKDGDFCNFLQTCSKNSGENDERLHLTDSDDRYLRKKSLTRRDNVPKSEKSVKRMEIKKGKLSEEEKTQTGNVKWDVITFYVRAIGLFFTLTTISTNVVYQIFVVASNFWLSAWSSDINSDQNAQYVYLGVYAAFGVGQTLSFMTQSASLYVGLLNAAKSVHNRLLNAVLRWPVLTFDKIPCGRILNRFSSDIDILDNILPFSGLRLLTCMGLVISTLSVISYNTPLFLCVLLPLILIYCYIQRVYSATAKQLQRLDSVSKSPIYSHFGDTVLGTQSVRAYNLQTQFIKTLERKMDSNIKIGYALSAVGRWLNIYLNVCCSVIILATALFAVQNRSVMTSALVGMSITYALDVTRKIYICVLMLSANETNVVAVERVKEYSEVEQEALWVLPKTDELVPPNWPKRGRIEFRNFQLRYHKSLEPVLKGINFSVNSGEKVGIVGRTGAGKSSLTLGLFRIVEPCGGSIFIDDIDISKIGLHTLRAGLTIIPQDPIVFSGTVRANLDPEEKYSDDGVIWQALESANLKTFVSSLKGGLRYKVAEGGSNLSVGQRQLMCLARALLRKTKILVLDEATAAVDLETDTSIQATIRKEFKDSTVLTIAHRLNTVLDYDRIMVLNEGIVVEFDSPTALLKSKESVFYNMMMDAGLI